MARKFSSVDTAEAAYEQLKTDLEKGIANKVEAIFLLNQIINDLPGTWIADLAKTLRDELESKIGTAMGINLKLSLRDMIKKDKDEYAHLSDIELCFLYHGEPKLFRELDSSKEAVEIYDKTDQLHGTEHYDTMTSWVQFAKEFLGFGYNDPFPEIYKEYKKHDDKEKWVKERIKKCWGVGDEEAQNALALFSEFSKNIYSVGNIVPVGYNPGKTRRNDRWELKLPWIYQTYFNENNFDKSENRRNAWNEFIGHSGWDDYRGKYFLVDIECSQAYPSDINSWKKFFKDTADNIKKRQERINDYLKAKS